MYEEEGAKPHAIWKVAITWTTFQLKQSGRPSPMRHIPRCHQGVPYGLIVHQLEYAHALPPIVGSGVDMNLVWERILLSDCDRRNVIKIAIHNGDNFRCGFL
jgi:hypothetical protein